MKHIIDNPMGEYARVIEDLKNPAVKMDMLARYAQGSNPKVPEFLALAEIKRRQSLVALSPQPSPTTVQEDLVKSATPQPTQQPMGLAAMQRPQGVAALPSGISGKAFAGGGIVAFDGNNGSLVEEDPDAGLGYFERFKRYVNNLGGGVMPRGGAPVNATPAQVQAVRSGKGSGIPMTSEQVKAMMPADQITGDESKLFEAEALAKKIAPKGESLPTIGEKGRMAPTTSETKPGEDMYAKYEEMLKGQAAESKAARQQDKYMRLLEAGLGIMGGTSPYALANIGQGAMGAAKGYAQDRAAAAKEDRENIKELMGLGLKKEEAIRENEKLAMTRDLYKAHGKYYNAAADAAGVRASGAAGMDKANLAAITKTHANLIKDAKEFDSPYHGKSAAELYEIAKQLVLQQGGGGGVVTPAYSWTPKGGLTPTGT
jgi:hypothetical protein